ncbi:MAG: GNAT family N-acetyltransferase, partial [Pseudomonadota bacterium]
EEAAARGLEAVTLTTFADIPWNAPFYAAMGFEVLREQGLTPFLAGALEEERALGLTERVAMRLAVPVGNQKGDDRGV